VQPEEVAAPPPDEPAAQPESVAEQSTPMEAAPEAPAPAPVDVAQNVPPVEPAVAQEETQQPEQPEATKGPMDMLAKLLRGESAHPDQS
jgi:hypothetical protein